MGLQHPRNPRYANADKTLIDMTVLIDGMDGDHQTTIDSTYGDLWDDTVAGKYGTVADFVPFVVPKQNLKGYADNKRDALINGGVTINIGTAQAPLNVAADTNADGKANIMGVLQSYALGLITGDYTWYQSTGALRLSQSQLQQVAQGMMTFVSRVFATWQSMVDSIESGMVTSFAQIDGASWPPNTL